MCVSTRVSDSWTNNIRIRKLACIAALATVGLFGCDNSHATETVEMFSFGTTAEYCVIGLEWNADVSKWTLRFNLEVPTFHRFLPGDVFVTFSHPSTPNALWFSGGESPGTTGFKPATWHSLAEHGPTAYYSGTLNPVIAVNVVSKPVDLSTLEGGVVSIGYGLRATQNASVADSYQEMTSNLTRTIRRIPVTTLPANTPETGYTKYCFVITGVKRIDTCADAGCLVGTTTSNP